MRRLLLIIFIGLGLVACGPATDTTNDAAPTEAPTTQSEAEQEQASATATTSTDDEQPTDGEPVSSEPLPTVSVGPSEVASIPTDYDISTTIAAAGQVKPSDWVKGNPDAFVLIVEYGDFQ